MSRRARAARGLAAPIGLLLLSTGGAKALDLPASWQRTMFCRPRLRTQPWRWWSGRSWHWALDCCPASRLLAALAVLKLHLAYMVSSAAVILRGLALLSLSATRARA